MKNLDFINTAQRILYQIMIGWGGTLTVFVMIGLLVTENTKEETGNLILGWLFIGLFPLVVGLYFFNKLNKRIKKRLETDIEVSLVRLAHQKKGKLLVPDVVSALGVTTNNARNILDELNIKGVFDIEVTSEGIIEYRLQGYSENKD
ncbi:MAG: hypothetical protein OHK0038_21850 [Flammeovirgaceae bacterium]